MSARLQSWNSRCFVLPGLGQSGDHQRRQARRAEELAQRWREVTRAHPMQIDISGNTSDTFGRLAALRRNDRARESLTLNGDLIDAVDVPPEGPQPRSAATGRDHPRPGSAATHHQPAVVLVDLVNQWRYVLGDSASRALASIRRAPSRQMSSNDATGPTSGPSSATTLDMVLLLRRCSTTGISLWTTRKVRRARTQIRHPQVLAISLRRRRRTLPVVSMHSTGRLQRWGERRSLPGSRSSRRPSIPYDPAAGPRNHPRS